MSEAVKKFMERCPIAVEYSEATGMATTHRIVMMPTKREVRLHTGWNCSEAESQELAKRLRTWLEDVLEEFEACAARKPAEGEGKG